MAYKVVVTNDAKENMQRLPVRRFLSTGQAGCRSSSWAIVMPTNWASVSTDCPWVFPFLCLPIARK